MNRTRSLPTHLLHRTDVRVSALAVVFAWGVYQSFWNLAATNLQTDEGIYASAGAQYLRGEYDYNLEHPPLAKYLMGALELLFGQGVETARILSGLAVLGGAAVTFVWLRREIGWWGGLLAAGMWLVLPRGIGVLPNRVDRYALLDPTMVFFMIAALAAGWTWMRTNRWWWAAVAGALMAASVTSKVSTAMIVPAFVLLPLLWRRWRALWVGALAFLVAFVAVFVAVYAPIGVVHGVSFMLEFQGKHDADGHEIDVLGHDTRFPPWWAGLSFALEGLGKLVAGILILGVALAAFVFRRPGRLLIYLGSAWALLLVFYLGISNVALRSYYYPWIWFAVVIAAIGIAQLARLPRWWAYAAAAALILGLGFSAARLSVSTWGMHRDGIGRVEAFLESHDRDGDIIVRSVSPALLEPYFGDQATTTGGGPFDAVVVGNDERYPNRPELVAMFEREPYNFDTYTLDNVTVYLPHGVVVGEGNRYVVRG